MTLKKWLLLCAARVHHALLSDLKIRAGTTDLEVYADTYLLGQLKTPPLHHPVELIIDGGAYTGLTSAWFARHYPRASVIAVEPDRENYLLLEENVLTHHCIFPLRAGLWHEKGRLRVSDRGTGAWGHTTTARADGEVEAVTIDSLGPEGVRIGILKLDVEGAERFLFRPGCESWLDRTDCLIIELHDKISPECSRQFWRAIKPAEWYITRRGEKHILIRKTEQ